VAVRLLAASLAAAPLGAQTSGSIAGRVVDNSAAALPGATVEATSASLQGSRARVTGASGEYRFPALPPGEYRVRATLPGFRAVEREARVSIDATATVNLTLEVATSEAVRVSADVPFVDTSSTTSMTSYTAAVIRHLPCGRDYASIVEAGPGVAKDRGASQGRSLALAIKGATSAENQWSIDGVNTTDVQRGIQGKAMNNDFVQEIEVVSGGYQAEYGRALGGLVNVVTKSGGNTLHGDGFIYFDSSATSAQPVLTKEDELADSTRIAQFTRREYGFDLGGYLLRDRLWFFGAYNRVEFPAEVSPNSPGSQVSTEDRFPLETISNFYSGKLTWNPAAGTNVVGSVFADPSTNSGAGAADPRLGHGSFGGGGGLAGPEPIRNADPATWSSQLFIGGTDVGLRATQLTGSQGVVEAQLGRHQDRFQIHAPEGIRTEDFTCAGGTPDAPCNSPFPVPNAVSGGFGFIFGPLENSRSRRGQYQLDWSFYAGDHSLKAGAVYQDARTAVDSRYTGGQLVLKFNEPGTPYYVHAFFADPEALHSDDLVPVSNVRDNARVRDMGAYFQDSWKPAPGWTVNAGLRWDRETVLDPKFAAYIRTSRFQPRLGIAWDPWRDGKTKIEAFGGRFFWGLPTDVGARVFFGGVPALSQNFDPAAVAQDPALGGPFLQNQAGPEQVDASLKAVSQDEVSVGVERQLGIGFAVGIKGTYRRLDNTIEDRCDLDGSNGGPVCGIGNPGGDGPIASGNVTGCNGLDNNECGLYPIPPMPRAKRIYRGIELLVRKSVGQKLWLQASYLYSSLRGNFDGAINESTGQTDPGINADFDYYLFNHNLSGRLFLDEPSRFRLDGYYVTPIGLSVGLQAFAASGVPLDKLGYFNFSYGSFVNLVPRGYAGRMPTQWDANLTLSYPFAIGPVTVTLQGYVYNLFNNQIPTFRRTDWNTTPPSQYPDIYDPNQDQTNPEYGKIVTRSDPRLFRAAVHVSF
jgi:hypothetical protein